MAKQIKVIKCPSCGNNKPISLGNDRFRCDKCGTEFFLDNDDINVNVNHNYETQTNYSNRTPRPTYNYGNKQNSKIGVWIFAIIGPLFIIFIIVSLFPKKKHTGTTFKQTQVVEKQKLKISSSATIWQLFTNNNKVYVFCMDNKLGNRGTHSFVIYDFQKDSIIQIANRPAFTSNVIHQNFYSTGKDYYILDKNEVWELDPDIMTISNITDTLTNAKPALNSGFTYINFLDQNRGDGFRLETKLGKSFYYFPKVDQLYTQKAFDHFANGGMNTVAEDAVDRVIYLFDNKESKESKNVAQLMKANYKYNNGGPEDKMYKINDYFKNNKSAYRVTSLEPIGEEIIAFSPNVLFSDSSYILISYYPTLVVDAPLTIELLDNKAESIWKTNIDRRTEVASVQRLGETVYLLDRNYKVIFELNKQASKRIRLY